MTETADQTQKEWCPLVGQRVFKSANQAWEIYGQYRFSVSQRTFNTYVGKNKLCPPRSDGSYYVEDIEIIAESKGWAPTSSFVRGAQQGGEGEAAAFNSDIGAEIQKEKLYQQGRVARQLNIRPADLPKPWHAIIARQAAQQPHAQRQRDTQAANAQRQPCRLHIQGRKALHKRPIHSSTPFG